MDGNGLIYSANFDVLARQATLRLRSPMNSDPDPINLPILDEIAALTLRAKAEFERIVREYCGYGVGDTVQHTYDRHLGSRAPKFIVMGFEGDPDLTVEVLLARIKKSGEVATRITRHSLYVDLTLVRESATEAA